MTYDITVMIPFPPAVFAIIVAILLALAVYWVAKFIISIYTGA